MSEQEATKLAMQVLDSTADNLAQSLVQVLYKDHYYTIHGPTWPLDSPAFKEANTSSSLAIPQEYITTILASG